MIGRALALLVHASLLLVGASGIAYAWMLWFTTPADEWSVVGHPWQPLVRHLHLLAAPLLVFAVGAIWRAHVWERLRRGFPARRRTGLCLAALFVPMAATGYLLGPLEAGREAVAWGHAAVGVLWCIVYGVHLLLPRQTGDET